MVQLGATYSEILQALGQPVEEKSDGEIRVLLYNASSMTLADLYYVQNDRLVVVSTSSYATPKEMNAFVHEFGRPEFSVRKYRTGIPDSLYVVVHVWPEKGRAVTTTGTAQSSVIREDTFAPTTLEEYLMTWGKDLVGHQEVAYAGQESGIASVPAGQNVGGFPLATAGIIVIVLAAVLVFVWRKRRQAPPSPGGQGKP